MKFTLYLDGIGFGKYSFRLSNVPGNLKNRAERLSKFMSMLSIGMLGLGAQVASASYSAESDENICPVNRENFDYRSPQGALYRLLILDTYPFWRERLQTSNLTQYLVTAAKNIPDSCGGKRVTANLADSSFSLVKHMLAMPYPQQENGCYVTALIRAGNEDSEFETCLKKNMDDSLFPFFWELAKLAHSEPWFSKKNILWVLTLACIISSQYLGWLERHEFNMLYKRSLVHLNDKILTEIGVASSDVNPDYICPISLVVMDDPVIAADGKTYDRNAITKWYNMKRMPGQPIRSPLTGVNITNTRLTPNENLKREIKAFVNTKREEHQRRNTPAPR